MSKDSFRLVQSGRSRSVLPRSTLNVKSKVRGWKAGADCRKDLVLRARKPMRCSVAARGWLRSAARRSIGRCCHFARADGPRRRRRRPSIRRTTSRAPRRRRSGTRSSRVNRRMLACNMEIDRWFFDPLTRGYAFVVPESGAPGRATLPRQPRVARGLRQRPPPARAARRGGDADAIRRQHDRRRGGPVRSRATSIGLTGHAHRLRADPGALRRAERALSRCCPSSGPRRRATARATWSTSSSSRRPTCCPGLTLFIYASIHAGQRRAGARDAHAAALHALEASSVDFYAALRSAYYQDRTAAIEARRDRGPRAARAARATGALAWPVRRQGRRSCRAARWSGPSKPSRSSTDA